MPDGRTLDVILSASPLTGAQSEFLGCIVLLLDVSGLKRAEEAVRQASEQRRLALEAASMGAWEYLLDSGSVFWDERCARIFGVSTGGQIDSDDPRPNPSGRPRDDAKHQQALAGTSGGAYDREFRVIWPDGSVHWVASTREGLLRGRRRSPPRGPLCRREQGGHRTQASRGDVAAEAKTGEHRSFGRWRRT